MPPSTPPPTVRRRRLGAELRRLRERADLTATQAGVRLGITQSRVSSIEAGRYGVSADRVRALARAYDCSDESLVNVLAAMTGERKRGWWEEYRELLPATLVDLTELEHHATALRVTQVVNIPGLLQTIDYARAVYQEAVPALLPHEIEHRVSHRIKRQAILHREVPPPYESIIHEAALRMQFGGAEVAKRQLKHLIDMSERESVTILVIPFGVAFPSTGGGIDYFHGPVPQLDTVTLDVAYEGKLIDAPAQLERYHAMLDRMRTVALGPKASRELIHDIARAN
ncbi:helix-turn-helix domain-containing protein [Streptomyces roseoverticillatus]|uniref:helix-turn-helix domain-containing protein n=1 Tax=Streptomyces roseoverticillatus TaxID=66429 RepID=UPI001F4199F5|nr:helix-turn-helix transcriptional regulator [Streptomyces roseoverticillatus]MCF3103993.1 helix-turn-helix domain-containing protein [Streptomyces roseoverticillatus]